MRDRYNTGRANRNVVHSIFRHPNRLALISSSLQSSSNILCPQSDSITPESANKNKYFFGDMSKIDDLNNIFEELIAEGNSVGAKLGVCVENCPVARRPRLIHPSSADPKWGRDAGASTSELINLASIAAYSADVINYKK